MPPSAALYGIMWPALIAAAVLLAGFVLRRWGSAGAAAGAIAIAAAFIACDIAIRGVPRPFPAEATRWLAHSAVLVGAAGVLAAVRGRKAWVFPIVCVALAVSVLLVLKGGPSLPRTTAAAGALATFTLVMIVMYGAGQIAAHLKPAWLPPLFLAGVCMAGAAALAQSYTASLAQLCAGIAAALVPVAIISAWQPQLNASKSALPIAASLLTLVLIAGNAWASLPYQSDVLLLLAALVPAALTLPLLRMVSKGARIGAGIVIAMVLCIIAVYLTPEGFNFAD